MSATIGIEELRVGMFVHLDLGWWAHPFALSSFLVQSSEQVATIRGLGLKRLRWSPEKSQPADLAPAAAASTVAAPAALAAAAPGGTAAAESPMLDTRPAPPPSVVPGAGDAAPHTAQGTAQNTAPHTAPNAAPHTATKLGIPAAGDAAADATGTATQATPATPASPATSAAAAGTAAPASTAESATAAAATAVASAAPAACAHATSAPALPGNARGRTEGRIGAARRAPAALAAMTPLCAAASAAPLTPLAAQRAAQVQCQAQYREAGDGCRRVFDQVQDDPASAAAISAALTQAMLDKMLGDGEMSVRTLAEAQGDAMTGHALNVTVISLLLGRVFNFSADEMLALGQGALLHDIGKLEVPERARHAELLRGAAEEALYRDHVAHGVALGQRMGLPEAAIGVIAQHHELADGSGFPQRMGLERMGIGARIVSLVDRYDTLCNPLQPAQAMTPHEALSLLFAQCRSQFDATMLGAFIRMMGVYPPGSVVQLTDDRYAAVVGVNSTRPLKPRVLVCDQRVPVADALLLELDRCPDLGIRRSLKPGQLPAAVRDYLSPRPRMVYFFEPVQALSVADTQALAA